MNGPKKKLSLFDYKSESSSSDSIDNGFTLKQKDLPVSES